MNEPLRMGAGSKGSSKKSIAIAVSTVFVLSAALLVWLTIKSGEGEAQTEAVAVGAEVSSSSFSIKASEDAIYVNGKKVADVRYGEIVSSKDSERPLLVPPVLDALVEAPKQMLESQVQDRGDK